MNKYLDRSLSIKSINDDGEFTGYGSVFGNIDSDRDIVMKGAFDASLAEHKSNGTMPSMLWMHQLSEPIGAYTKIEEDSYGLYVEGRVLVEAGEVERRAHAHMKAGTVTGMSIGFKMKQDGYEYDDEKDAFLLKEIDLKEISVVTLPSNDAARIQTVKMFFEDGEIPPPSVVERVLRDAGFTRPQAKAFLSKGYSGVATRDAEDDAELLRGLLGRFN